MTCLVMRAFCVFDKVPPNTFHTGATQKANPEEEEEKGTKGDWRRRWMWRRKLLMSLAWCGMVRKVYF